VMQAVLSALAVNEKQTGCTDPAAACVRQLKGRDTRKGQWTKGSGGAICPLR
jgi:hypothetical protein